MGVRKLFAITVSACVLGAQLAIILPPFDVGKTWYWPFLNYPMYSPSKPPGSAFTFYELRGASCERDGGVSRISATQLGIRRFRLYSILRAVGEGDESPARAAAADSNIALIDTLLGGPSSPPICTLQLWRRVVVVGPAAPEQSQPTWSLVRTWPFAHAHVATRAAAPDGYRP